MAQAPEIATISPSPPGSWKSRCSARAKSIASTPTLTSSTAASTKEKAPKALRLCSAELAAPLTTTVLDLLYQGSSIETNSPSEIAAASRRSRPRAPHALSSLVIPAQSRRAPA